MIEVKVELGERSYPIAIGTRILSDSAWWDAYCRGPIVALVTCPSLHFLYGERVAAQLRTMGKRVVEVLVADNESDKSMATLSRIHDALIEGRCDRRTTLVALGGGVIGDIAGFAAATYQRGIALVLVPTTLLAQVDASVGGKNAVNHRRGKNLIGTFHQPRAVLCDVGTLASLTEREYRSGLAEVIKHGAIADARFFAWLEEHIDALAARSPDTLIEAVRRSCVIKAAVVGADEREVARRAILNFGHTFGHAIEAGVGYGTWSHGEAVSAGMVQAADLSVRVGRLAGHDAARIRDLLARAGLPVAAPDLGEPAWRQLMALDKKSVDGELRFVLLDAIGSAYVRAVPAPLVAQTLAATVPGTRPDIAPRADAIS